MSDMPPLQEPLDPGQPSNPYSSGHRSHQPVYSKPASNLVWAILATLCCFLPTGIAAIVYAARVDGLWAAGDHAGAVDASKKAAMWSWISLGVCGVVFVISFFLGLVQGAMGSM